MVQGGNLGGVAGDARRIIEPGGCHDLIGELPQLAGQLPLLGRGQEGEVGLLQRLGRQALGGDQLEHRADAGVGVLDIVDGIFAALLHRQVQVKIEGGIWLPHIEEEPRGIDGHVIQQVGQCDGAAAALAHAVGLAVLHQPHQLHQHDIQLVPVQADGIHGAFEPGNVAVVVGAPDIDDPLKAALGKFIVVIGNIGGKVGGDPVGPHQHVVLQLGGLRFGQGPAGLFGLLGHHFDVVVPQSAVFFVGPAAVLQLLADGGYLALPVQLAFPEPDIVADAVAAEIPLQGGDVLRQRVGHQRVAALLLRGGDIAVAVKRGKGLGVVDDIQPLIAVLRQGVAFLALEKLQVPHRQRSAEFIDLVAGVVDVEFPGDAVAAPFQGGGQAVADGAAAGVAHVHGAGGVGGNKFHHDLFAAAVIAAAEGFALLQHLPGEGSKPGLLHVEIDEAGPGDLAALHRQGAEIKPLRQQRGKLLRGHAHGAGVDHGGVGGKVAVGGIAGDLHHKGGGFGGGQQALGGGCGKGGGNDRRELPAGLIEAGNHSCSFSLKIQSC